MSGHATNNSDISGKSLFIMFLVAAGLALIFWLLDYTWIKEVEKMKGANDSDSTEVVQQEPEPQPPQAVPQRSAPLADTSRRIVTPPERQVEKPPPPPVVSQKEERPAPKNPEPIPAPAVKQEPPPPPKVVPEPEWVLLDSMTVRCPRQLSSPASRDNSFYRPLERKIKSWKEQFPGLIVNKVGAVYYQRHGNSIGERKIEAGTWLTVKIYKYQPKEQPHPELVLITSTEGGPQ